MAQPTRWSFDATVDSSDKSRLRAFVRNEINYFNEILLGFSSRLRTSPELFTEVNEALLGEVAAYGYNVRNYSPDTLPEALKKFTSVIFQDGKLVLSERILLLLDVVISGTVLHPAAKRALAIEVLREHIRQADALRRTTAKFDQVLQHPVELLHPTETRIKRHIQLPRSAVVLNEARNEVRTAYNGTPIVLRQSVPAEANWNIMVVRDDERPGHVREGGWSVEFRQEKVDYLPRLTDTPFMNKKPPRADRKPTAMATVLGTKRR